MSNAHVCTSLMKYPDETVFNEGPYCDCIGCHGDWKADDWMAISWPHYERGKLRRSAANSVIAESQLISGSFYILLYFMQNVPIYLF